MEVHVCVLCHTRVVLLQMIVTELCNWSGVYTCVPVAGSVLGTGSKCLCEVSCSVSLLNLSRV